MASKLPEQRSAPNLRQQRREQAQRRARQRAFRRRVLPAVVAVAIAAIVAAGFWWDAGTDDATSSQALFTFETNDFHSLAFDLGDADRLYFGHHGGLLVSRDAGATWEPGALQGVDAMQQALALADPPRHYVAGHDLFQVSTDGGQTWQPQANNLPNLDLHTFAGSPADPSRLYAIPLGSGLWTSDDGGQTWLVTSMPPGPDAQPIALAVAPNRPETVFLTRSGAIWIADDAGGTWREEPGPPGVITALAIAADDGGTRFAGTSQGVFRRDVSGAWERLPLDAEATAMAVAVSPVLVERIAILDQAGNLYRSDDSGATWE